MLTKEQAAQLDIHEDLLSLEALAGEASKICNALYALESVVDDVEREFNSRNREFPFSGTRVSGALKFVMDELNNRASMLELTIQKLAVMQDDTSP